MVNLGHHIQSFRKKQHLSQAQLEQRSGIKREYISRLERGELKNPTLNTLSKIAAGLGVALKDLLACSSPKHSLQELLQQAEDMEQQIVRLKNELDKLRQMLNLAEEKIAFLLQDGPQKP